MEQLSDNFLDHTEEWDTERVDQIAQAMAFRNELRRIDSRFDVIYVKEGATSFPEGNRFYIVRHNEVGIKTHWMVHDGRGGYCVPDSRHLDMIKRNDLSNVDVAKELAEAERRKQEAKVKAREAKSEEFRTKLLDRLNHLYDARVSVPRVPSA